MNTTQATGSPCGEMLLRKWLTYWLENYIRPVAKPSGYEHYRDNVEKHILPRLGDTPMSALSPRVLQQFFNEEARSGNLRNGGTLSPKSMRNMRVVLDVALKQALAEVMAQYGGRESGDMTVILELDHREFGRAVVKSYNQESKRVGVSLAY